MIRVQALQGFHHGADYRRGEIITHLTERTAQQLASAGLVRILPRRAEDSAPFKAVGAKSSASPAAQASTPQTLSMSGAGDKPKRTRKARPETVASS